MLKKVLTFFLFATGLSAQNVAINDNNANPDPSAMLDVQSTNKGMLVPRMTTAQRTAIANPAVGLLVFDTDFESFWFKDGTGWVELGGNNPWNVKADTIYTTNKNVAIGTSNAQQALRVSGNIGVQEKEDFNGNDGGILMYDQNGFERVHLNKVYSSSGTNFRVEVKTPDEVNGSASVQFFRNTVAKDKVVQICQGKGNSTVSAQIGADGKDSYFQADGGNLGIGTNIPTHLLEVNGVARSSQATWATGSDRRAKTNILPIYNASSLLNRLNPVTFNWKEGYIKMHPGLRSFNYGFIAQDVEAVIPEMVTKTKGKIGDKEISDFRLLNYDALFPIMVKAAQEQQAIIENQKTEITDLKTQLTDMQKQMKVLLGEIQTIKASLSRKNEGE